MTGELGRAPNACLELILKAVGRAEASKFYDICLELPNLTLLEWAHNVLRAISAQPLPMGQVRRFYATANGFRLSKNDVFAELSKSA